MNYLDLDVNLLKNKRIAIVKNHINVEVKDVYDYLIYKNIKPQFIISNDAEQFNYHFQDVNIITPNSIEFDMSSDIIDYYIVLETDLSITRIDALKTIKISHEVISLHEVKGNYSDANGNVIINESGACIPTVIFIGNNNKIIIHKNVKIAKNIRFELHQKSFIEVCDYSSLDEGNTFIAYSNSQIIIGGYTKTSKSVEISSRYDSNVHLSSEVSFGSYTQLFCKYNSKIKIGEYTSFGKRTTIISVLNSTINIGNDCMGSYDVSVIAGDGHSIYDKNEKKINSNQNILIGNHVWLGIKCTILGDSTINDGIIIGANSVITKQNKACSNSIVVGNPSRPIRSDITWKRFL